MTTRRSVLKGTMAAMLAAVPGSAVTSLSALAAPQVRTQAPAYYRMMLGDIEVTALSDGTVPVPLDALYNHTTPDHVDRVLAGVYLESPVELSVNAYLVNDGERLVLIDAGTADLLGPKLGHLTTNLRASGYRPEQVDDVVLTHIHTDHSGGLIVDGRLAFPNATVHANKRDADYWLDPANMAAAPDDGKGMFREAVASLAPYAEAGRFRTFGDDAAPVPGLGSIWRPGHTPGHSSIVVESRGEKLVVWGDITHGDVLQFDEPGVAIDFDVDSETAIATRRKAFAEAAEEGYWVAGAHISFPGIGHVRADDDGYDWVPINYGSGL
ncbi:MAG TPA: MBL fold metallo-hydrolase [Alphaproteobacteria bacterium]|nr:MBL fold metallo-hydrolase [Alphaproteobacteria bacterium]